MDNGTARIHADRHVCDVDGMSSTSQSRLCTGDAQMNEQWLSDVPTRSLRSSDSDQFARDELPASDKRNIGGRSSEQGYQGFLDACQGSDGGACEHSLSTNTSGEYPSQGHMRVIQAPSHSQEAQAFADFSASQSPGNMPRHKPGPAQHQGGDADMLGGSMASPTGRHRNASVDLTIAPMGVVIVPKATLACKRDSATAGTEILQDTDKSGALRSVPQSAEDTASPIPPSAMGIGRGNKDAANEGAGIGSFQQAPCAASGSLGLDLRGVASAPSGEGMSIPEDITNETTRVIDSLSTSSLPIANSSQVEPEIDVSSTPLDSRNKPTLGSPVQLEAQANIQSTPPTSPMKLSSPPPLKPTKKVNRIHTGPGAPFQNPWPRSVRRELVSSPLPPSSPPPIPTSPPPGKRRRVDSDSEDRPIPFKVRRTGQLGSSPFVSPLRKSQGAGPSSRTRPPAGGFSTPQRSLKLRNETFSSPILPSQPDVFTTPATAARSSPAYRHTTTLGSSPTAGPLFVANATSASSSYTLRPPRAVTRPFKPPAKSTRPTTATVQALRQRLQLLRNALRIRGLEDPTLPAEVRRPTKAANDDELEALALQWRSAAREAAQDLWALVRDTMGEDSWSLGDAKSGDGWGSFDKPQRLDRAGTEDQGLTDVGGSEMFTPPPADKVHRAIVKNLGRPVVPRRTMLPSREIAHEAAAPTEEVEDAEPEGNGTKYHTLGTMLTSLGIPHDVLGWREDEGEFMD